MPVYNEERTVEAVLRSWLALLDGMEIEYELRVYDDGSTDRTPSILRGLALDAPRLGVIGQDNRGHGPTLVRGYEECIGDWVFQTDSDGEIPASEFVELWRSRNAFDYLLGYRVGRTSTLPRRAISVLAALSVRALFGRWFRDVNVPFRLIRRSCLHEILPRVPREAFAPNVLLSGLAASGGLRIEERPVRYAGRQGGETTLKGLRVIPAATRAFRQAATVRWRGEGIPR